MQTRTSLSRVLPQVTAMAARVTPHVKTFTVSFPGHAAHDESPFARIVARAFGTEHTELAAEAASVDILPHPAGWTPAGIGDFNHDGSADLAWFNSTTGGIDIWELANGQWSASSDVGTHPAGYQPVGFGDYNHDGTRDVLWFNPTTRDVDLWEISNGHWSASVGVGPHPAGRVAKSHAAGGTRAPVERDRSS